MTENIKQNKVILGCGDIGQRIVKELVSRGDSPDLISGFVNSRASELKLKDLGINAYVFDADNLAGDLSMCAEADVYYTIAPQKSGLNDLRSAAIIKAFKRNAIRPNKLVLISTTGLYGDCGGDWVTEESPIKPQTERGQRRLDSERQWLSWGAECNVGVVILRVPGIYARSRLPRARLQKGTPVVKASECGFSNRVHADDLANMCVEAMLKATNGEIYNASDGQPGKIPEYLQAAAESLGLPALAEISMLQAQSELSSGMLSYLNESRKISNEKILSDLAIELRYPDFKVGILN